VLWARYGRGEISQPALARERFRRLLRQLGADPGLSSRLGETFLDHLSRRGDRLPGCRATLVRLARAQPMDAVERAA